MTTRSVGDALKETSRKRKNSDIVDIEGNDSIKKCCIEPENKNVNSLPPANSTTNQNSVESVFNNNVSVTTASTSSSVKISNIQKPPKPNGIKLRRVNNEFTSSLSSSLSMLTRRRKLSEQSTSSSNLSNEISFLNNPPSTKKQCHLNFRDSDSIIGLNNTVTLDQITPTPAIESFENRNSGEPFRIISVPIIKEVESKVPQKPKLTSDNQSYEESANKNNNTNDDDIPKIAFVKPKSDNSISEGSSVIERTQKTKLAKGNLDEGDGVGIGNYHKIEEKSGEQNKEVSKSINNFQTPSISTAAPILRSNKPRESLGGFKHDLEQAGSSNQDINKNSEKDNQPLSVVTLSPKGISLGKLIAIVTPLPFNKTSQNVRAVTTSTSLSNNAPTRLLPKTTNSSVSTIQPRNVSTLFTIPAAISVTSSNTFAAPATSTISRPLTSAISLFNTTNALLTSLGNNNCNSEMKSTSLVNNRNNLTNLRKTKTAKSAKQIVGLSKLTQRSPKSNLRTFKTDKTTSTNSTNSFNVSPRNKTFSSPQSSTNLLASAVSSVPSTLPSNTFGFWANKAFGMNSTHLAQNTFAFNANNITKSTPVPFRSSASMTTFGSNTAVSPTTSSNTFALGTSSTNPPSGVFVRKVTNNIFENSIENISSSFSSNNNPSPYASLFGNPLQKSATFSFGSVNNGNSTTGAFTFDNHLNTNNTNLINTSGMFNFCENKPSAAVAPPSSFNSNNTANPSTGFSFDHINSTNNFNSPANNENTIFSFGGSNNQRFSFTEYSTPAPPATNNPAAFNFTGNSTTNNVFGTESVPAANTSNTFSFGNNPAAEPTDKPIRRTTRRLDKSKKKLL